MSAANSDHADSSEEDPTPDASATPRMHGLWEFMPPPPTANPKECDETGKEDAAAEDPPTSRGKSLWAVMQTAAEDVSDIEEQTARSEISEDRELVPPEPAEELLASTPPATAFEADAGVFAEPSPAIIRSRAGSTSRSDWWD